MLCTWWVYNCGSNAGGGEQASLSTKADFTCGSSPLPMLLGCMGLPTGSNLSFRPYTRELHQYQQLNHKRVKAMDSQSIPVSFMTTRLRFPQQAFCLTSLSRQYRSSCLCNLLLGADLPVHLSTLFLTFEPVRKKKTSYLSLSALLLTVPPSMFAESVAQWWAFPLIWFARARTRVRRLGRRPLSRPRQCLTLAMALPFALCKVVSVTLPRCSCDLGAGSATNVSSLFLRLLPEAFVCPSIKES